MLKETIIKKKIKEIGNRKEIARNWRQKGKEMQNRNINAFHKIAKDRKVIPDPIDDRKFQE